jgi:transporter family-2 protein
VDLALWIALVVAGCLMPVQPVLNAWAAQALGSPWWAALVSFAVGTAVLGGVCFVLEGMPSWKSWAEMPLAVLWAGPLGVLFVTATLVAVPRLGVFPVMVTLVAGQLLAALVMDHYGWLGVPRVPLSVWRIVGGICVLVGVVLVRKP